MSDQYYGKKEIETVELYYFTEAYEYATGEKIEILKRSENPDFICSKSNDLIIGIELVNVMRDPRYSFGERIIKSKNEIDVYDSIELIHHLIEKKEKARSKRYVKNIKDNILVLQLIDISLNNLNNFIYDLSDDFTDHGFHEIWIADHTGLEAYGDVELFCLFPSELWGYYQRPWPERKPYG